MLLAVNTPAALANPTPRAAIQVAASQNIVEVAQGNPNFSTLVSAIQAADLAETLKGAGPFTVFAPTNAAFDKLPAGALQALLQDKQKLRAVLLLHVIKGKVTAAEAMKKSGAVSTVQGQNVTLRTEGGKVMINNATVITPDIAASNGVIHVIDAVLLPK
ncbi:MAG: fasciclin domain-containing protein [Candidatus Sericytochromatia bacterium]|nr:fasciclin domain-containing protein [Candidatus Sericytochromatia bacterium]